MMKAMPSSVFLDSIFLTSVKLCVSGTNFLLVKKKTGRSGALSKLL